MMKRIRNMYGLEDRKEYIKKYELEHPRREIVMKVNVSRWIRIQALKKNCSCSDIIEELIKFKIAKLKEKKNGIHAQ